MQTCSSSISTTPHRLQYSQQNPAIMAKLTPVGSKKRKVEDAMRGKTSKPRKRIKKQKNYHSSSEDEQDDAGFAPVNLGDSDDDIEQSKPEKLSQKKIKSASATEKVKRKEAKIQQPDRENEEEEDDSAEEIDETEATVSQLDNLSDSDSNSGSDSETQSMTGKKKSKRNDPEAFATSMSKILSTKLTTTQKKDPVLSRSIIATKSRQEATDQKLEAKVRARLRAEKHFAMQKGRTTDVLGIERGISGQVAEKEKQLRKIATKGVIQLFNAFRGAYEKAEQTRRDEQAKGTIGLGERGRKIGEVGKEEFLERIAGKKSVST